MTPCVYIINQNMISVTGIKGVKDSGFRNIA